VGLFVRLIVVEHLYLIIESLNDFVKHRMSALYDDGEIWVAVQLEVHPVGYTAIRREDEGSAIEADEIGRMDIDIANIQTIHDSCHFNLVIT
jgi:hypothetical protein